jgi:hypothetical protein
MKNLKLLGIAICISLIFTSGDVIAAGGQSNKEKEIEKLLLLTSKKINEQLPMMVDVSTRLDMTAAIGNQLLYKYTMIKVAVNNINKDAFSREMRAMLVTNQCNNENTLKLLKYGVLVHYEHYDKNGIIISTTKISKKDCGL